MQTTRVLVTGMSGTGKSTLLHVLAALGHATVDTDEGDWCEWRTMHVDGPDGPTLDHGRYWREERMQALLTTTDAPLLFVSGCVTNQGRFYPHFEHVILLSAPTALIIERLAARTSNAYGKRPDELAEALGYIETVEPLLRRRATLEIDTSAPLDAVMAAVLRHVLLSAS